MEEVNSSSPIVNPSSPHSRENTGRDENGRFKPGVSGNPAGRVKNTMKDYLRQKFNAMTDEEKEAWLEQYKIPGEIIWKMAEGNPDNKSESDVAIKGNIAISGMKIIEDNGN